MAAAMTYSIELTKRDDPGFAWSNLTHVQTPDVHTWQVATCLR